MRLVKVLIVLSVLIIAQSAYPQVLDLGGMAKQITKSMLGLAKLITSGSLVAGMGFAVGAVLKFKQHKDNPTQIPVGTPIALLFISAALLYLPTVFSTLGHTLFGNNPEKARIDGYNVFVNDR